MPFGNQNDVVGLKPEAFPLKARYQIPLWKFRISNFSRNFESTILRKYWSKNNFKHIVWKLGMHIFRIYHQNPLCLILYWFREGLRTTWCFRKSENMSTSNEAKTVWKWGRVIMIIPEVKSMDLQLSNGVSTNTTWQIVAGIHKFEIV